MLVTLVTEVSHVVSRLPHSWRSRDRLYKHSLSLSWMSDLFLLLLPTDRNAEQTRMARCRQSIAVDIHLLSVTRSRCESPTVPTLSFAIFPPDHVPRPVPPSCAPQSCFTCICSG